jgi:Ribonuclease G/E
VKSEETVAHEALRAIRRTLSRAPAPRILVNLNPGVADYLYEAETSEIERIEREYATLVIPVARDGFHRERYEVVSGAS